MKENNETTVPQQIEPEQTCNTIRGYILDAQKHVYFAVNQAMVTAYWNIGREIYEVCGENERAAYGKQVISEISARLSCEFGSGYSVPNLRRMRQFYLAFRKQSTLSSELSWSHYQQLMRVSDEKAREFYTAEAAKAGWSVRQLQRQINTLYYNRILASRDKESVAAEIDISVPKPEYEKSLRILMCWNFWISHPMNIIMNRH